VYKEIEIKQPGYVELMQAIHPYIRAGHVGFNDIAF
jgi:hypothetical protein